MKKLILILSVLLSGFFAKAQIPTDSAYPIKQAIANTPTTVGLTNAIKAADGFINGTFTDTAQANNFGYGGKLKYYPGAQIFTTNDNNFWVRNSTAKKWIQSSLLGNGSTVRVLNDSQFVVCNINSCDTILVNSVTVNSVTFLDNTHVIVCDASFTCDTITIGATPLQQNLQQTTDNGNTSTNSIVVGIYPNDFTEYYPDGSVITFKKGQWDLKSQHKTDGFYFYKNRQWALDTVNIILAAGSNVKAHQLSSGDVLGDRYHDLKLFGNLFPITLVNPAMKLQVYNTAGNEFDRIQLFNGDSGYVYINPTVGKLKIGSTRRTASTSINQLLIDTTTNEVFRGTITGGSTINIINDTTINICSNGTNLCDTFYVTTIGAIQRVIILNDSTLLVCDSTSTCDTLHIPTPTIFASGVTASNGVFMSTPTNVKWGAPLIETTTIDGQSLYQLYFKKLQLFSISSDIDGSVSPSAQGHLDLSSRDGEFGNISTDGGQGAKFYFDYNNSGRNLWQATSWYDPGLDYSTIEGRATQGGSHDGYILIDQKAGNLLIDHLTNGATQNRLVGQISSSGRIGYVTIGTGLQLNLGVLSSTVTAGLTTADNGLTANTSSNVRLGGTLLQNTTIDATSSYGLFLTGSIGSGGSVLDVTNTGSAGAIKATSLSGVAIQAITSVGYGIYAYASGGGNGIQAWADNGGLPIDIEKVTTATNTIGSMIQITRQTFSAGANGIGSAIEFVTQTSTSTETPNRLISKWTDATNATRTSQFIITGVNSAVTADLFTLSGSGSTKLNKYGIGTFTGTPAYNLQVDASGNLIESIGYKVYTALISQSGTSAPTVSVLENTLGGTVSFNRTSAGQYQVTTSALYTTNKTFIIINAVDGSPNTFAAYWVGTGTINIVTRNFGGVATDDALNITSFEIRVYN